MQQVLLGATQITKFEILDNWKGREGPFIESFLLNTKRNKNGWRVTKDAVLTDMADFINHPGTYLERFGEPDHPEGKTYKENMANQELARVTNIIDLKWDEDTETLYTIAEIIDEDFERMWREGKINFTSPGIWPLKMREVGKMPDGRPKLDVDRFRALHQAYVNDPAFGDDAYTVSVCEAGGETCKMRMAAKTDLTAEDLAPLQEIPLIRNTLNNNYTPCQIKDFHAQLIASTEDSCVPNRLKAIAEDNPDKALDWQLAAAYAMCQDQGMELLKKAMWDELPEDQKIKWLNR